MKQDIVGQKLLKELKQHTSDCKRVLKLTPLGNLLWRELL